MIFAVPGHIEQIRAKIKYETRRLNIYHYKVGHKYSVQPTRTSPGIPDMKIFITDIWKECIIPKNERPYTIVDEDGYTVNLIHMISEEDAIAEGNYTPENYERLFRKINPHWDGKYRWVIKFKPVFRQHVIQERW